MLLAGCTKEQPAVPPIPKAQTIPGAMGSAPDIWPSSKDTTATLIKFLTGPAPDDTVGWARARAEAIDLLAKRHAVEAIPYLIECVGDTRGLIDSDNWVGGHAGNALQAITGQALGYEKDKWQIWWNNNKQDFLKEHGGK